MLFSFSVPSKVILFGEHAAVYGFPTIASAIDLRMFLNCSLSPNQADSEIRITYNNDKFNFNPFLDSKDENSTFKMYRKAFLNNFPQNHLLKMNFTFNGPDEAGLGSSAALCTLVAAAVQYIKNQGKIDKNQLIIQANELEKFYHSKSSGIDINTVVNGSSIIIRNGKVEKISLPKIPLLIVDSGVKRQAKSAIDHVSELISKDKENTMKKLESLGLIAEEFYVAENKTNLHNFFSNSQDLLSSLGLSCPQIDDIVKRACQNSLCAKLTGAGMGGVVLVTGDKVIEKQKIFEPYKTYVIHLESEGFRYEKPSLT